MVFTQWPSEPCDYGPDENGWTELYLLYPERMRLVLRSMGVNPNERSAWSLDSLTVLQPLIAELMRTIRHGQLSTEIDRIDRYCERLILESLLHARSLDALRTAVDTVRNLVEGDPSVDYDFNDALARANGLSPTHFRRLWVEAIGCPPTRYLLRVRIQQAARELAEGTDSIQAIAAA